MQERVILSVRGKPFEVQLAKIGTVYEASAIIYTRWGPVRLSAAADEKTIHAFLTSAARTRFARWLQGLQIEVGDPRAGHFAGAIAGAIPRAASTQARESVLGEIGAAIGRALDQYPQEVPVGRYDATFDTSRQSDGSYGLALR